MAAALLLPAAGVRADAGAAPGPAGDFSFDQLSIMEVSGVSKAVERLHDAPAAATVVTADDIRAFGFRTLGDVLNAAPGFFSYSDHAYDYVGVRGFAPIESYNSRVLLLIDGFPSNDDVYQQALLGNEAVVDLSLVDRVEIIPGPSSSVYGTNALLGVVNVILKNPSQVASGGRVWIGSGGERGGSATYSGTANDEMHYLLQASESATRGLDVTFPPEAGLPAGERASGVDGTDIARVFAKLVDGNLRVNVAFSERRQHSGFGLYGAVIGDPRSFVRDGETFADLRYEGVWDDATDYVLRASAAEYRYDTETVDAYPPGLGLPPVVPGFLPIVGDWLDVEATATHHFSRENRLVFGTEVRRDLRQDVQFANPVQGRFLNVAATGTIAGAYAQSDVDWSEHWSTSVGLRGDSTSGQQDRVSPRLALLWKPTADQVVKLLSGSAFRNPSVYEQYFAQPPLNPPSPKLLPERLRTLDLEYEAQLGAATRLALTAFRYRAMDLVTPTVVDAATGATNYQNAASAQARGVDLALDQQLPAHVAARLSTAYTFAYDANGNWEQNSPRWTGRFALTKPVLEPWRVATEALYEGPRLAIDGSTLPAFVVLNATLSSTPQPGRATVALGAFNLLNRTYAQPVSAWAGAGVNATGRTWRATIEYTF